MLIPPLFNSLLGVGLLALSGATNVLAASGGSHCVNTMCVGATISGGNTFYTLNTTIPFSKLGWIAIGFGTRMAGSPMVILWPNSDGTITLSQRSSTDQSEPKVDTSPARVATVQTALSTFTGSAVTLSFSAPSSGQTTENLIYGLSMRNPGSKDPAASLQEHNYKGNFQLDLTQTVADLPTASSTNTATGSTTPTSLPVPTGTSESMPVSFPYTSTEKMFIGHGVFSAIGFCFLLPIGVLQARFLRIWWPKWFKTHWIVQAGLAGPFIIVGFGLGVYAVHQSGGGHFDDKHMIIGLILLIIYAVQALYGYIIHVVKSPNRKRRPIQNYGHSILGLGLITLSLYQVWSGFDDEWSSATGRDQPGRGLYIFWIVWVVALGIAYVVGLALLPKQYDSEARSRNKSRITSTSDDAFPMTGPRV